MSKQELLQQLQEMLRFENRVTKDVRVSVFQNQEDEYFELYQSGINVSRHDTLDTFNEKIIDAEKYVREYDDADALKRAHSASRQKYKCYIEI